VREAGEGKGRGRGWMLRWYERCGGRILAVGVHEDVYVPRCLDREALVACELGRISNPKMGRCRLIAEIVLDELYLLLSSKTCGPLPFVEWLACNHDLKLIIDFLCSVSCLSLAVLSPPLVDAVLWEQ